MLSFYAFFQLHFATFLYVQLNLSSSPIPIYQTLNVLDQFPAPYIILYSNIFYFNTEQIVVENKYCIVELYCPILLTTANRLPVFISGPRVASFIFPSDPAISIAYAH